MLTNISCFIHNHRSPHTHSSVVQSDSTWPDSNDPKCTKKCSFLNTKNNVLCIAFYIITSYTAHNLRNVDWETQSLDKSKNKSRKCSKPIGKVHKYITGILISSKWQPSDLLFLRKFPVFTLSQFILSPNLFLASFPKAYQTSFLGFIILFLASNPKAYQTLSYITFKPFSGPFPPLDTALPLLRVVRLSKHVMLSVNKLCGWLDGNNLL